jgi:CRP/FNR family transcriptional regulator, cyclic AMP receptor protein
MAISMTREEMLAAHFVLRHLRPEELARVAASASVTHYKSQQTIFQKGDPGASMMAVVSGRVKICAFSVEGKEIVLNYIDRGSMFGEISLLDGQPRSADAVAIEQTELLVLERNRVLPILTANPEIIAQVLSVLCQRLRQTSEALEDALLRDVSCRVARGLLRLARAFGKPVPKGLRLDIQISQQQLGSVIGITRESVNKVITEWSRAGYLSVDNRYITILDRDALESLTEAEL